MTNYNYYPAFTTNSGDKIPASPRLNIFLSDPDFESGDIHEVQDVILDTGADITLIRVEILHGMSLLTNGRAKKISPLGGKGEIYVIPYEVGILLNNTQSRNMSVFGYQGMEDMILGRDILNFYSIYLNGPSLQFSINP